jgi:hypothetical protein
MRRTVIDAPLVVKCSKVGTNTRQMAALGLENATSLPIESMMWHCDVGPISPRNWFERFGMMATRVAVEGANTRLGSIRRAFDDPDGDSDVTFSITRGKCAFDEKWNMIECGRDPRLGV